MNEINLAQVAQPASHPPSGFRDRLSSVSPLRVALFYLAVLTIAEVLTTLIDPRLGLILHGLILITLMAHATLVEQGFIRRFLFSMTLMPLIRMMSLSLPLVKFPFIYWYAIVGAPLFLATLFAARASDLGARAVGLSGQRLILQLFIGLSGIVLGFVEYAILRPEPLVDEFSWGGILVPALILLFFTGALEEVIFRGVLQHTSIVSLGTFGLFYVAIVFAVLHLGYRSLLDVVFVFMVALYFGVLVLQTSSLLGVTLAHGLTNIMLFLVMPFVVIPRDSPVAIQMLAVAEWQVPDVILPTRLGTPQPWQVTGFQAPDISLSTVVAPARAYFDQVNALFATPTPWGEGGALAVAPAASGSGVSPTALSQVDEAGSAVHQGRPLSPALVFPEQPSHTPGSGVVSASPTPTPQRVDPTPTPVVKLITQESITIPAGPFWMGCDPDRSRADCSPDETPLHTVNLDSYTIDKYEVTNAQYAACVAQGACDPPATDRSITRKDYYGNPAYVNYPVVNVTWLDAMSYCTWAGGRLPTEAEWEKAARGAHDPRIYPWGNTSPNCDMLNYYFEYSVCVGDTQPVGSYPKIYSPYGLLDVVGNVDEWVADWYDARYYQGPASNHNPAGPDFGDSKVTRGGSWNSIWSDTRIPRRNYYYPAYQDPFTGFRCAGSP